MAKVVPDQFPAGLRVLVVDDDVVCLKILVQMLQKCAYNVTCSTHAIVALNLLREKKGCFDLVLSDVHMPDMDGFKLLEHVGLEMDLPVIMISGDGRTSTVLRGIRHGACDFLVKPVREEELKNIWQHVVRKMWNGNKEREHSGSVNENDRRKSGVDDADYASSDSEGSEGTRKTHKKKKDVKDEDDGDGELENGDPNASKKPRVVWSVELHQQFVSAVNQLGIDKAVPKRILELMNVPGLTRENVASHLQKFRLYLKRLSGVGQQQVGVPSSLCGSVDQNLKLTSGRFDIQALAASGQIPPETLAAFQAELLGRPMDQPPLLQATLQGPKCTLANHGVSYGPSLIKCPSNISKQSAQPIISNDDVHSGLVWPSNSLSSGGPGSNIDGLGAQNGTMLMSMLPHQQQQRPKQSIVDPGPSINVQPSCLVIPAQSSTSFQVANSPGLVSHNRRFNGSSVIDYSLLTSQPTTVLNGYSGPGSSSPCVSSCSVIADTGVGRQVQNSAPIFSAGIHLPCHLPSISSVQGFYSANSSQGLDQGQFKNLGFVGKGTKSIPSRFAVDDLELPISNLNQQNSYGESSGKKVKQEPNVDFIENAKMGTSILQHFAPNDFMSVFSE